ncbi:thioredoxin family protein [Aquimarina sp. RZ0]|uniref:DUF1223 domain-containing protein n=1 Tax=Aquimarina sp. RZ0 TaxID=2607730 RepID=UPI0011F3227A|nr:DUF1223 domain-containing protein [Aquimarina sp. RZ0]KAA1243455.1 DUF1223 domain-containing protein [Aquimarina sp. RZ0]
MIKNLLILLTITCFGVVEAQDTTNAAVVLELFTSQGCSSCPLADTLLDEIKKEYKNKNVFVLSYHVDYWNRLGWKDPFSSEEFSNYQRDYAQQFYSNSIYTPQLVVNGSEHFTGSNSSKAQAALKRYGSLTSTNSIELNEVRHSGNTITFDYKISGSNFKRVTLALVVSERTTKISRGENRNLTLKNTNIVANRIVKMNASGQVVFDVPNWIDTQDKLSVIVYTQDASLKTTGATKINI